MEIRLIHVNKSFGNHRLFADLNLAFREGRIHCLMGASGSGKTTLLSMLMGLEKPDSGEIKGMEGKRIAAVFQEDRLVEHWDGVKNVKLACARAITRQEIAAELKEVGIDEAWGKAVRNFSGGMRRRVAIVRALLAESDILILDEPFKGLDEQTKMLVMAYVKKKTQGKTVILVTHDKEEAKELGAELSVL